MTFGLELFDEMLANLSGRYCTQVLEMQIPQPPAYPRMYSTELSHSAGDFELLASEKNQRSEKVLGRVKLLPLRCLPDITNP